MWGGVVERANVRGRAVRAVDEAARPVPEHHRPAGRVPRPHDPRGRGRGARPRDRAPPCRLAGGLAAGPAVALHVRLPRPGVLPVGGRGRRGGARPEHADDRPKLPRRLPRPIPEDRLLVALEAAGGRVRAYLFLAAFAGLRAAEIAGLRREDIREGGGQPVIVVTGKGRKERVLPLAPVLLAELRLYGLAPAGFVFGRFGDPARAVSPATVSSMSNEYLHGLGFTETLHTLRHRFASRCYQLSLDLRLVQEMLGHSSPTTTAGYAAFAPDAASAVVARLDGPRRLRAVST